MKKTLLIILIIVLAVAVLAAAGLFIYKRWLDMHKKPSPAFPDDNDKLIYAKETVDTLSYEYIVRCVTNTAKAKKDELDDTEDLRFYVFPNKMAQDYYKYSKDHGVDPFQGLTDEELGKMVLVHLATEKDGKQKTMWGKLFIANNLADDYLDFIPDDKYTKK